jgi:peptide methionine sulfoxide reductase MsrB
MKISQQIKKLVIRDRSIENNYKNRYLQMPEYWTVVCKFSGVAIFKSNKKKIDNRVIIMALWFAVTSLERKRF